MAKPESERPSGAKFWVAADVEKWIKDNVPESKNPAEDAIWWKAYRDAEMLADSGTKDIARTLVAGVTAYNADDVTSGLQDPLRGRTVVRRGMERRMCGEGPETVLPQGGIGGSRG